MASRPGLKLGTAARPFNASKSRMSTTDSVSREQQLEPRHPTLQVLVLQGDGRGAGLLVQPLLLLGLGRQRPLVGPLRTLGFPGRPCLGRRPGPRLALPLRLALDLDQCPSDASAAPHCSPSIVSLTPKADVSMTTGRDGRVVQPRRVAVEASRASWPLWHPPMSELTRCSGRSQRSNARLANA